MRTTYLLLMGALALSVGCANSQAKGRPSEPASTLSAPPSKVEERAPEVVSQELSEFEGRYRVGNTTCTVKPVKMAFELRWAQGKGVMHFFYDSTAAEDKPTFVSEDRGQGRDKFIFDDTRYDSGRFVRADGKTFAVQRVELGK
jgi:hypothetical protein